MPTSSERHSYQWNTLQRGGNGARRLCRHGTWCLSGYFCSDHDDPASEPKHLAEMEFAAHVVAGADGPAEIRVNIQQATAELNVLYDRIDKADPEYRPAPAWDKEAAVRRRAVVLPGSSGHSWLRNRISKPLLF